MFRVCQEPFFLPVRILLLQGRVKRRARTQRKELFSLAFSQLHTFLEIHSRLGS